MSRSPAPTVIDREKDCPFLLKMYHQVGRHHSTHEYQLDRQPRPEDELQIYTWSDATLGELALLVQEVVEEARHPDARLTFRLIYLDVKTGRYLSTDLGRVVNAEETPDQTKTLNDCRFMIGDYLDIAVHIGDHRPSLPEGHRKGSGFSFRNRGRGGRRY
ncbi:Sin3 associated polypeptide p18-domain-containing protein [Chlamydoabsidia padenii]|nr:Sin3 associated polypeptide p18-domain-containing protein [Chlamydoabsidia padenii]